MFVGADELWLDARQGSLPLHVIEFSWDGYNPSLTVLDHKDGDIHELDLTEADFTVGRNKTCIGYFEDDRYVPCPASSRVERFSQCESCSGESFIPFQECVFEPRCEGEICGLDFCKREHVLYLAFYNTIPKIGMSSTRRVERRLVEQGADAFSIIGSYPNRLKARMAEKEISSRLRISQGIRQTTILNGMTASIEESRVSDSFDSIVSSLKDWYHLRPEPLSFLDGYPLAMPLKCAPTLLKTYGRHRGELVGVKGKWMIYESGGLRAISLQDLVGRHMAIGAFR